MSRNFWTAIAVVFGVLALAAIYYDASAAAGALAVITAVAAVFAGRASSRKAEEREKSTRQ